MVALNREVGTVMELAVDETRRFAGTSGYDSEMERCVTVGDVPVEGNGGRLKDWRRVATRYDRCPTVFFRAIAFAATVTFWLWSTTPAHK